MKKIAFFLLLATCLVSSATQTQKKIEASKKVLNTTLVEKKRAKRQLEKIASDIKKTENEIEALEEKIAELEKDKDQNEIELNRLKKTLQELKQESQHNLQTIERKRKKLYRLLSEHVSIVQALKQREESGPDAIIKAQIYSAIKRYNTKQIERFKKEIHALEKKKTQMEKKRRSIVELIEKLQRQKKLYVQKKERKAKLLKKLERDEDRYSAKLQKLEDKQGELRQTLAKLNILHKKEVEEARKRAEARKKAIALEKERKRKLRLARQKAREKARKAREALRRAKKESERAKARKALREARKAAKQAYVQSEKVRQINSSYKKPKLSTYRGGKTIPPFEGAKVVKKFGTYIDPIYKIKVFNEGVTLQAPRSNMIVKAVLSGKVVYAGNSSMLGKVVVLAHGGKMHTIYAGLSKIAPTIRVGRQIRKGYVIGKVKRKLIFQATKNSKHINPLKLIRL